MEKHTCKTYFSVNFQFDREKNAALLRERRTCSPEEIGIFNRDEVEKFISEAFGVKPKWNRHHFIIGGNAKYASDVNRMLAVTLKDLFGKEDKIKEMQRKFGVSTTLGIVPCIAGRAEKPPQELSLSQTAIDFLYLSDTGLDLDYYVL